MMKAFIIILLLLSACTVRAQLTSKKISMGMSAGIAERLNSDHTYLVFNPKVGYTVNQNMMLLTDIHYLHATGLTGNAEAMVDDQMQNGILAGVGFKYFLIKSQKCGTLYLGSSVNRDFAAKSTLWFLTPGIFYDFNFALIDLNFDISGTDLIKHPSHIYLSAELGISFTLGK